MNATSIYKSPAGQQTVLALYDSLLTNWPTPMTTRYVNTRSGSTFVISAGAESAPPLVLLHGAGSNSAIWAGDFVAYTQQYQVHAVDLIGEPGKSAPSRPPWAGPAFADWLADVFAALNIERASLIGLSQGGWAAIKYAVSQPERVHKLILLCPGGVVPDKPSFLLRATPLSLMGQRGARKMVRMMFGKQPVPDGVEEITTIVTANFRPRIGTLPLFSDQELSRLAMPVYLLGGTADVIRDNEQIAARLHSLLPDVSVSLIQDAGHALIDTTGLILDFLAAKDPEVSLANLVQ